MRVCVWGSIVVVSYWIMVALVPCSNDHVLVEDVSGSVRSYCPRHVPKSHFRLFGNSRVNVVNVDQFAVYKSIWLTVATRRSSSLIGAQLGSKERTQNITKQFPWTWLKRMMCQASLEEMPVKLPAWISGPGCASAPGLEATGEAEDR